MTKINKIIKILLIICLMNVFCVNLSQATVATQGGGSYSSGDVAAGLGDLDDYAQDLDSEPSEFRKKANRIIGIIQVCGSIFSVIALIAIGIKYMFSSIEEKAEYKKTMMGYIIGCIMVFALTNVLSFVYNIANS